MKRKTVSFICMLLMFAMFIPAIASAAQVETIPVYAVSDNYDVDIAQTGADTPDNTELKFPQIRVITEDGNGTKLQKADGYVNAEISITDTDGSVLSDSVSFKVRGNTTSMTTIAKKAYTFKFSKKKYVLGMGSGKKWALIASAFDPTLLRNYIAFDIAYELGLDYTSNQKYVEVWVDNSFRGCYILYEPVQEGKDRVDIDIESNGGKKDFLIEYEAQREEEDVTYFTVNGLRFISSEPEEPDDAQLAYITDTMSDIIDTLKNGTEKEIREKLDVESFVKFYLLNEFVKTYDFDMSSVFFYYKDGKLYAGPAWDYDLSAGNVNVEKYPYYYRIKNASTTDGLLAYDKNIYKFITDKQWFNDETARVYNEHFDFFKDIYADGGLMDTLRSEYGDAFERNYSTGVWKVSQAWINIQKMPLPTYEDNFNFLKNWYKERNEWLSEYFGVPYILLGDADGNGYVDIVDATSINRAVLLVAGAVINETASDVDEDGEVTILDATFIQRYDAKLTVPYKIGDKTRIL